MCGGGKYQELKREDFFAQGWKNCNIGLLYEKINEAFTTGLATHLGLCQLFSRPPPTLEKTFLCVVFILTGSLETRESKKQ